MEEVGQGPGCTYFSNLQTLLILGAFFECLNEILAAPRPYKVQQIIWVVVIRIPFMGTVNNRCRIIIGTPKGTIILTTTHNTFSILIRT